MNLHISLSLTTFMTQECDQNFLPKREERTLLTLSPGLCMLQVESSIADDSKSHQLATLRQSLMAGTMSVFSQFPEQTFVIKCCCVKGFY